MLVSDEHSPAHTHTLMLDEHSPAHTHTLMLDEHSLAHTHTLMLNEHSLVLHYTQPLGAERLEEPTRLVPPGRLTSVSEERVLGQGNNQLGASERCHLDDKSSGMKWRVCHKA